MTSGLAGNRSLSPDADVVGGAVTDATTTSLSFPPGPGTSPRYKALFWYRRAQVIDQCVRRYGDVFSLTVPVYGHAVVVAEPEHARQVCTASNEEVGCSTPNLGGLLGASSVLASMEPNTVGAAVYWLRFSIAGISATLSRFSSKRRYENAKHGLRANILHCCPQRPG